MNREDNPCIRVLKEKDIPLKDPDGRGKSIYRIINPERKEVTIHTIDGCLIQEGERCDYLVAVDESRKAFYVELKGHDLNKAMKQIIATFNCFKNQNKFNLQLGRIVPTKVNAPKNWRSSADKLRVMFFDENKKNGTLGRLRLIDMLDYKNNEYRDEI